jgi:hypothetical protein
MREKLKLSSDGSDSGGEKCKRGCGGAYGGVCVWPESEVRRFCVGAFGRNLGFSHRQHVSTINFVLSMRLTQRMLQ